MRRTRHTILTAFILLAGCATDDNRLGGQEPLDSGPDGGVGTGGTAGAGGSGGSAGSGGTSNPTGGSGGSVGADLGPPSHTYTASLDWIVDTGEFDDPSKCLPRTLQVETDGKVPCVIAEAVFQAPECGCSQPGFRPAPAGLTAAVRTRLAGIGQCAGDTGRDCNSYCVCEMDQFTGAAKDQCLTNPTLSNVPIAGWCYVDPEQGLGDPALVSQCPAQSARKLRFRNPAPAGINFLACADHTITPSLGPAREGALGEPCIPSSETQADNAGFSYSEVSVELGSRQCSSGLCLVNHFGGRVTCPYGQPNPSESAPECAAAGTGEPIGVTVNPQDSMRRSMDSVYCSCRCAGPGPGPFCECAQGYACTPLVADVGLAASSTIAGSYCVKQGTEWDGFVGPLCNRNIANCE